MDTIHKQLADVGLAPVVYAPSGLCVSGPDGAVLMPTNCWDDVVLHPAMTVDGQILVSAYPIDRLIDGN